MVHIPQFSIIVWATKVCQFRLRQPNSGNIMTPRKRKEFGQYIVADPEICGGQLTFKGTRIFVQDILAMLAKGYDWDRISAEFDGRLSHAAIAEAIEVASAALSKKTEKWRRAA